MGSVSIPHRKVRDAAKAKGEDVEEAVSIPHRKVRDWRAEYSYQLPSGFQFLIGRFATRYWRTPHIVMSGFNSS